MGSKTRLSSYCTKRANNGVNLVTSRKINTRLARPIVRTDRTRYPGALATRKNEVETMVLLVTVHTERDTNRRDFTAKRVQGRMQKK